MSKVPVPLKKSGSRALRQAGPAELEVVDAAPRAWPFMPFVRFSYSYTEISAQGDTAHVRSRQARLEDGKLVSESFEGEAPRSAYDELLQTQQQVMSQASLWLKSLSWFLPMPRLPGGRD